MVVCTMFYNNCENQILIITKPLGYGCIKPISNYVDKNITSSFARNVFLPPFLLYIKNDYLFYAKTTIDQCYKTAFYKDLTYLKLLLTGYYRERYRITKSNI